MKITSIFMSGQRSFFDRTGFINTLLVIIYLFSCFSSLIPASTIYASSTLTLYPTDDACIYSYPGGYGDREYIRVGYVETYGDYRSVLKFDISSIPTGSTINSAYLKCYYYAYSGSTTPRTTRAYRITSNWNESSVTWNNNYNSTSFDSESVGGENTAWFSWDITTLVKYWGDRTYPNYGVLLKCYPEGGSTNNRLDLYSKEHSSNKPYLVIDYTPPAQPLQLIQSSCYVSPTSQDCGDRITVYYYIYNPNSSSVTTTLACSIKPVGVTTWINDESHDKTITVISGYSTQSRYFDIPSSASPGKYTVAYAIKDGPITGPYFDIFQRDDLTVTEPFTVTGVNIDINPEKPATITQGGSITGNGTITGTDSGTVQYYWMVRKPGGVFISASSLLSTQMTNGSASVPSFSNFPTSDVGEHKVWLRIQSPNLNDSLSNEEFYTVTPLPPIINWFYINNNDYSTSNRNVTLNSSCNNNPTHYMASEYSNFSGATWNTYSSSLSFTLSSSLGTKRVYFKVKNDGGESDLYGLDDIELIEPFTVTGVNIDINPEKPATITQGGSITGNGTITGTGSGTVQYYWMVRKPGGVFVSASSLLSTQMTNGSASVPSFSNFPTSDVGEHKVWLRIQSPNLNDSLSNEEFYTVTEEVSPIIELILYRISDTTGESHTSAPGTIKNAFSPGDPARITLAAKNTGSVSVDANWVLNIATSGNHENVRYNSDPSANNTNDKTIPNDGNWCYLSFDWVIGTDYPIGLYDIGAAIRRADDWYTVLDDTESGANTRTLGPNAWLSEQLEVKASTIEPEYGTTIITHGFNMWGDEFPLWVEGMGTAILNKAGQGAMWLYHAETDTIEDITLRSHPVLLDPGFQHNFIGEQVILVDWRKVSNDSSPGFAEATGHALYSLLMGGTASHQEGFVGEAGNRRPFHFIGHSFGTVVNSEAIQRLGALQNITVDQMTTLDAHDWDEEGVPVDEGALTPDVRVWENILYADNYYCETGGVSLIPHGRPIWGTQYDPDSGYYTGFNLTDYDGFGDTILGNPHTFVHTFYYGTIFPEHIGYIVNNNEYVDEDWYEHDELSRGYAYSRLGGEHNRDTHFSNTCRSELEPPDLTGCGSTRVNHNGNDVHVDESPQDIFDGDFSEEIGELDERPGYKNMPRVREWPADSGEYVAVLSPLELIDTEFETHLTYIPENAYALSFQLQADTDFFGDDDTLHVYFNGEQLGIEIIVGLGSPVFIDFIRDIKQYRGKSGTFRFELDGNGITASTVRIDNIQLLTGEEPSPSKPAPPIILSATAMSTSQINLSWLDNSNNEDGFMIERRAGTGGTYSQIASVPVGVTSYPDTGLSPSTTYYYRIRSYNIAGDSDYSNEVHETTQAPLPTIMVTSPMGSTSWQAGTQHNITWGYTGDPGTNMKIELYKDGNLNLTISGSTSIGSNGNGSYSWTIPSGLTPGSDYQIKVTSLTNSSWNNTSANFIITAVTATPTITMTSPTASTNWPEGTQQTISWTYTGDPGPNVKIELLMDGVPTQLIKDSTSIGNGGNGSCLWAIPVGIGGRDYQVKVTSLTNSAWTNISPNFTISVSTPPPITTLTGTVKLQGNERPDNTEAYNVGLLLRLYEPAVELDISNIWTQQPLYQYANYPPVLLGLNITNIDFSTHTITFTANVPVGTYNIALSTRYALTNLRKGVNIPSGGANVDLGTLLVGNANEDNQINGFDYAMLVNDFAQLSGDIRWNYGRCDFDHSGQVTLLDLSLLAMNYKKTSPQAVGGELPVPEVATGRAYDGKVVIAIDADPSAAGIQNTITVEKGAQFTVIAWVLPQAGQHVVCVDTSVDFNTSFISVDETKYSNYRNLVPCNANYGMTDADPATPENQITLFNANLSRNMNNIAGYIEYSDGIQVGQTPITTAFPMYYIIFNANELTPAGGTPITLHTKLPRATDAFSPGDSPQAVAGQLSGITVRVVDSTTTAITVISPNGSDSWQAGTQHNITWGYTGAPGSNVKVELFKAGNLNSVIKDSTSIGSNGNGSCSWPILAGQTPGSDYQVKVTSLTNSTWSSISANFAISVVSPTPVMCLQVNGEGLADGAPIPGWNLLMFDPHAISTSVTATAQSSAIVSGSRGVRINGDYQVGFQLEKVAKGNVTIGYWHYPEPGTSTNSGFCFYDSNGTATLTVWKNDEDKWWVSYGGFSNPSFASYSGSYTHFIISINTVTRNFDINMNGSNVFSNILGNANIGTGGFKYISTNSGRGGMGTNSYFDDFIITYTRDSQLGDANGDGAVNALDITKVERIIAGLDTQTPGSDANQDGEMNALDITKTERLIAGLE